VAKKAKKPVGMIVRRGALRRFDALTRKTANLPVVVSWDRRVSNGRDAQELHTGNGEKRERRRKPPFTWEAADFVVVDAAPEQAEESAPRMAKAKPRRTARTPKRKEAS
jgi:hypothetical protein